MVEYGLQARGVSDAPDVGGNGTAGAATDYSWTVPRRLAHIFNDPSSGCTIRGRWNTTSAAADNWEFVLSPGDEIYSPPGVIVPSLTLYFSANATLGTNFSVRGWD